MNLLAPVDELDRRSRIHRQGHPDGVAVPHGVIGELDEYFLTRERRLPGCFGLAIAEAILIAHCRCFRGR